MLKSGLRIKQKKYEGDTMDLWFANLMHGLAVIGGGFFTPFFRFISMCGEKSIVFLLIAFIMVLRKKSRWVAITIIISIFISWIVADFIIKPLVMRPRPYQSSINLLYDYWVYVGSIPENNFSMPSGHTLGCAAFFSSLYFTCKNRRSIIVNIGIVVTFLMIMSRCYFMHHYLTDCLVAVILAVVMSILGKIFAKIIYKTCKTLDSSRFFSFILNFDIVELILK